MEEIRGDAEAIIEAVEKYRTACMQSVSRMVGDRAVQAPILLVPDGMKPHSVQKYLDEVMPHPERRKGTAKHTTLSSFCEHVKRFADEHSAVFAHDDPKHPRLVAVLDYHEAGSDGVPRWGEHRAIYDFPVSDEWKAWTGVGDLDQRAFAEFLEDRIADVLEPSGAGDAVKAFAEQLGCSLASPSALMALSRGLSVRVDQKVAQHLNLSTGEAQIAFEETHREKDGGGPLKVPGGFAIAIPVFRGGAAYKLPVRLRYRVRSGQITWRIALHRADRAFVDAFEEACNEAHGATGLTVFRGTPEA